MNLCVIVFAFVSFTSVVFSSPVQYINRQKESDTENDEVEIFEPKRPSRKNSIPFEIPIIDFHPMKFDFPVPDFKVAFPEFPRTFPFNDQPLSTKDIEDFRNKLFSSYPQIGGTDDFFNFNSDTFDPSKVKNKTVTDTKIIDGNIIETKESVLSFGDKDSGRILRVKTVNLKPIESDKKDTSTTEATISEISTAGSTENTENKIGGSSTKRTENEFTPRKDVEVVSTVVDDLKA